MNFPAVSQIESKAARDRFELNSRFRAQAKELRIEVK